MATQLETFITLSDAAAKYRLSAEVLTRLVNNGKIRAVRANGDVLVAEGDVAVVAAIRQARDAGDELVSISEAARRLNLNSGIVWWWYKRGWLPEQGRGPNRVIFVSLHRARALADLREKQGKRGRRLIPRGAEVQEALKTAS